jgi:twitching motility protein PilT
VHKLTHLPRGLILVTGPTGSGKSTTLAGMVDAINKREQGHIITMEDPIEYAFISNKCSIEQREVGVDVPSFASGLKHSLRQDPDVILVGEIRDLRTVSAAITAAGNGSPGIQHAAHRQRSSDDRSVSSTPAPPTSRTRFARC